MPNSPAASHTLLHPSQDWTFPTAVILSILSNHPIPLSISHNFFVFPINFLHKSILSDSQSSHTIFIFSTPAINISFCNTTQMFHVHGVLLGKLVLTGWVFILNGFQSFRYFVPLPNIENKLNFPALPKYYTIILNISLYLYNLDHPNSISPSARVFFQNYYMSP